MENNTLPAKVKSPKRPKKMPRWSVHLKDNCRACQVWDDPIAWYEYWTSAPKRNGNADAADGRKARRKQRGRLLVCGCGHRAAIHVEDELGSLLKCSEPACGCTHFHYAAGAPDGAYHNGNGNGRPPHAPESEPKPLSDDNAPPVCPDCERDRCDKCTDPDCICPHRLKTLAIEQGAAA